MAEQSLDVSEAGSVAEEMGGAGVPENVRRDSSFERSFLGVSVEIVADGPAVHTFSANGDPESPLSCPGVVRPACLEVSLDGLLGFGSERDEAVFVPLP